MTRIDRSHPLLKGCRLFAVLDNTTHVKNLMGLGPGGTVFSPGVVSRIGRFPALTFNGTSTYLNFGQSDTDLRLASGDITIVCRHRYSSAQIAALVDARDAGNADGYYFGPSNFGGDENGTVMAVFKSGSFLEVDDNIGPANLVNKDLVSAGSYSRAGGHPTVGTSARSVGVSTRVGEAGPRQYGAVANTGLDWDVVTPNPLYVGRSGALYFAGLISWVMVFDRALPAGWINPLMMDEDWPFLIESEQAFEGTSPPPPPPPVGALIPPAVLPLSLPWKHPTTKMRPIPVLTQPPVFVAPAGAVVQAFDNTQVQVPGPRNSPVPGPWRTHGFVPVRQEFVTVSQAGTVPFSPPPVPPEVQPPFPTNLTIVPGPWNRFGRGVPPAPLPPQPVPPVPGVPPPPPPGTNFGPPRKSDTRVPRVPDVTDARLRPHIDKVAGVLNSLLMHGYITATPDGEYVIVGGGRSLPRAPAATDDVTLGAVVGQTFVNTLDNSVYVCVNNSRGSAVWVLVSA